MRIHGLLARSGRDGNDVPAGIPYNRQPSAHWLPRFFSANPKGWAQTPDQSNVMAVMFQVPVVALEPVPENLDRGCSCSAPQTDGKVALHK